MHWIIKILHVHVSTIMMFSRYSVYTSSPGPTHYDILEIGRQATSKEIKQAYITLCRKVSIKHTSEGCLIMQNQKYWQYWKKNTVPLFKIVKKNLRKFFYLINLKWVPCTHLHLCCLGHGEKRQDVVKEILKFAWCHDVACNWR